MRTLCIGGSHDGLITEENDYKIYLPDPYQKHRIGERVDVYIASGTGVEQAMIKLVSQYQPKGITGSLIIGAPDPQADRRPYLIADEWARRQEIEAKLGGITGDWAGPQSTRISNSNLIGDPPGSREPD